MGLQKSDLSDEEHHLSKLGHWHANLIHVDRRKCVLFVNDKTLLNFIAPDVSRTQIKKLGVLFRDYLECVLAEEGIVEPERQTILSEYADMGYANTSSKRVLGSLNDLAFHYEYHILEEGGVHSDRVPSIISRLNRMPMKAIDYSYPIEALERLRLLYQA